MINAFRLDIKEQIKYHPRIRFWVSFRFKFLSEIVETSLISKWIDKYKIIFAFKPITYKILVIFNRSLGIQQPRSPLVHYCIDRFSSTIYVKINAFLNIPDLKLNVRNKLRYFIFRLTLFTHASLDLKGKVLTNHLSRTSLKLKALKLCIVWTY